MNDLLLVILFSLIGGVFSLVGGFMLLGNKTYTHRVLNGVTPFAAGALLAAAFVDLLAEATHEGNAETALMMAMIGIALFFLLERFVRWFHHHHTDEGNKVDATVPLIILGDTVHNFIDGIAIASAFLISVPTGIVTTFAVAVHEIPQEIGDFGLLLQKGMKRASVIKANILSALATTIAAVLFFTLGQALTIPLDVVLGLVAGFFIYIAVSDIIPTIHENEGQKLAGLQTAMLLVGIIVVSLASTNLHRLIETETAATEASTHEVHHEH